MIKPSFRLAALAAAILSIGLATQAYATSAPTLHLWRAWDHVTASVHGDTPAAYGLPARHSDVTATTATPTTGLSGSVHSVIGTSEFTVARVDGGYGSSTSLQLSDSKNFLFNRVTVVPTLAVGYMDAAGSSAKIGTATAGGISVHSNVGTATGGAIGGGLAVGVHGTGIEAFVQHAPLRVTSGGVVISAPVVTGVDYTVSKKLAVAAGWAKPSITGMGTVRGGPWVQVAWQPTALLTVSALYWNDPHMMCESGSGCTTLRGLAQQIWPDDPANPLASYETGLSLRAIYKIAPRVTLTAGVHAAPPQSTHFETATNTTMCYGGVYGIPTTCHTVSRPTAVSQQHADYSVGIGLQYRF